MECDVPVTCSEEWWASIDQVNIEEEVRLEETIVKTKDEGIETNRQWNWLCFLGHPKWID